MKSERDDFTVRYRFPRPISRAYEAVCFSVNKPELLQRSRWCARETVRFLGAVRQSGRLALNDRMAVNPPSHNDFKGRDESFSPRLILNPPARLLQLAGIYPGGNTDNVRAGLQGAFAQLEDLARCRIAIVEDAGFRVLLGPRIEYPVPFEHDRTFLEGCPAGTVLLVDVSDGAYLSLNPLLIWRRKASWSFGRLFILRSVLNLSGLYTEVGMPGTPSCYERLQGRPVSGMLSLPDGMLDRLRLPNVRFPDNLAVDERYEVMGLMWRGGTSDVFVAHRLDDGKAVVLKTFEGDGRFDSTYWHFINEEKFSRAIVHPNVVKPQRIVLPTYGMFYEQPWASRGSLEDFIASNGVLEARLAASITAQLLDTLQGCHAAGVIHNDIKPENILFDDQNRLRLIDFGIAHRIEQDRDYLRPGVPPGSQGYMAPEIASGGYPSTASDLYSVGVVLFRMLSGREPGDARGFADILEIPDEFKGFLCGCLDGDPSRRFGGAAAAISALKAVSVRPQRSITLDIEGTLLDNYGDRNPRPGLNDFLEFCLRHFDRIFVYTMLDEAEAEELFSYLEDLHLIPTAFRQRYEFVRWDRPAQGHFKDLRRCRVPLEQNAIVDDNPEVVPEDQQHRWIRITGYHEVRKYDRGLVLATDTIMRQFDIFGV